MGDNPFSKPMYISDLVAMLKKKIGSNERPINAMVIQKQNRLVDAFNKQVLKKICDSKGKIVAGQAYEEWQFFYDGHKIKEYMEAIEKGIVPIIHQQKVKDPKFPSPSEAEGDEHGAEKPKSKDIKKDEYTLAEYWAKIIENSSPEELYEMGQDVVAGGWNVIHGEIIRLNMLEKWEKVYKGIDDPLEWRKRGRDNIKLWSIEFYGEPFWNEDKLKEMKDKVSPIIGIKIQPTN